jgi:hypothetical protein
LLRQGETARQTLSEAGISVRSPTPNKSALGETAPPCRSGESAISN